MVDRRENPDPALIHGLNADAIGTPHFIRAIRRNRSVVQLRGALGLPMGRQQGVLAHQAQHTGAGDADVVQDAQPRPYFAVTLAGERRCFQIGADGGQEVGVRHLRLWATPLRAHGDQRGRFSGLLGIEGRTGNSSTRHTRSRP